MKNRRPWIVGPFAFIPLTQGYVATVDLVDLPVVGGYRWYAAKAGTRTYAVRVERTAGQKQRTIMMHRALHKTPDGFDTDHKDRNGLHNCRTNLRTATPAQNQYNRLRQVNNSSGVKGVSWHRVDKKWQARIKENGKYRFLGYFDTIEAAAAAREVAAKSLHGEFYRG